MCPRISHFAIDGKIAVEVRRLNQMFDRGDGSREGLEERSIPLWQGMERLFQEIGSSTKPESWFVFMKYRRPLEEWSSLKEGARIKLRAFMRNDARMPGTLKIADNFELRLTRTSEAHGAFFVMGGGSDLDSGGWLMSELGRNLRLCIAEKERKIAPYRDKYAAWWLVLDDRIDYGVTEEDRERFRSVIMPSIEHGFARIVLIDPRDHRRAFVV